MTLSIITRDITDQLGNLLEGAVVTVRAGHGEGGSLAELFADAAGETEVSNPVTVGSGTLSVYAQPGRYRLEGTSSAGSGVSLVDTATISGKQYSSRAAFVADVAAGYDPADGTVVNAEGLSHRRDTGFDLPALNNWRPADNILDIRHTGSSSDLSSDFAARFQQACDDAGAQGWTLRMSPIDDGSPYEMVYIDHTLTNDLHIHFEKRARWFKQTDFQDFPTEGTTGPFVITAWPYDASAMLSAMLVGSDNSETKLDQNTDFTVSTSAPYTVTLTATPPAGSTLRVADRGNALRLRGTPNNGRRLYMTGYMNIDLSRAGYVIASASGSGLGLTGIDNVQFDGTLECYNNHLVNGYEAEPLNKRADSAFVPFTFKRLKMGTVIARGMCDIAVYASGGATASFADRARSLRIDHIYAERCSTAMKYVRRGEQATIGSIHIRECATGFVQGVTSGLETGGGIQIGHINGVRVSRRLVDWRQSPQGCNHIGAVTCRDFGFLSDGETLGNGPAGLFMAECAGLTVGNLDIRQREWPTPTNVAAIQASGENNFGNRVLSGYIDGLPIGIRETGGITNDTGCEYKLTLKDCATPLSIPSESDTLYDLTLLTESAGTITTTHKRRLSIRRSFTPVMLHAGRTPPEHHEQDGTGVIDSNGLFTFTARVRVNNWEFTPTDAQLRIELPHVCQAPPGELVVLPVSVLSGINAPATNVEYVAEIPGGQSYARIRWKNTANNDRGLISDANMTSGSTVILQVSGSYFVDE